MRIIKIYNNKESAVTYNGQTILSGEYHQITTQLELENLQINPTLLGDLSEENPLVIINYGESDLDYNNSIQWLMGINTQLVNVSELPLNYPFYKKELEDGSKLYRRKHGVVVDRSNRIICQSNSEKMIDFIVPYPHAKVTTLEIINANSLDSIDILVLDDESGTYSKSGVKNLQLNKFGFDAVVTGPIYIDESNYDADLYYGMIVRFVYKNTGVVDSEFGINIVLHEVKS